MLLQQWSYATNRCVYAFENMAAKIRRMEEEQLETCSPHLVFSIFVAARFYISKKTPHHCVLLRLYYL